MITCPVIKSMTAHGSLRIKDIQNCLHVYFLTYDDTESRLLRGRLRTFKVLHR